MTRTAAGFHSRRGAIEWSHVADAAVWLVPLALAAGLYFWTVTSGAGYAGQPNDFYDYYNLLAHGFRDGHLYLPIEPSRELLALSDPFDPVANAPYRLHDASLYEGRYYLYFGPVPALLLFLPWSLLPLGGDLPGNVGAAVFAVLGLGFNLLLLRFAIRRWLPATPRWMAATAAMTVAMANVVPFVLRRPAFYEQVILAGYFLTAAAAWLLVSGLLGEQRSWRRIGLASLCLGLAVGCRPNLALLGAVLLLVAIVLWRSGAPRVRTLAIVFGPFVLCGIALMAYNQARFGSPVEFGQRYQLAGVDAREHNLFSFAYLAPGLFYYLLSPARHDIIFPFFHLSPPPSYPGTLPNGYIGVEPVGGLFANLPILLLALGALALPWHARLGLARPLGRVLAVLVVAALVLASFVSMLFYGATQRYEVDFAWMLAVAAVLVWLALAERLRGHQRARRAVQAGGVALILWGAAFSTATSLTGYLDTLRSGAPDTYGDLASLGVPLQTAASAVAGKPLMLEVANAIVEKRGPGQRYLSSVTFVKSHGVPGPAEVLVASGSDRTVRLLGILEGDPGMRLRISGGPGAPQVTPVEAGELNVSVRLTRGLNRLYFDVLPPDGTPPGDVRVRALRLR